MNAKISIGRPRNVVPGLLLTLFISILTALAFPGAAQAAKAIETEVTVGKSIILTVPVSIKTVSVTDPTISDYNVINPKEIQIIGRNIGSTTLIIWDNTGAKTFFDVNVVGDNTQLMGEIGRIAPGDDVHVTVMKDMIIISGTVSSYERMFKIKKIVEDYKGGKEARYQMVNLVEVSEAPQVLLQIIVASIDRKATRDLGINWAYFGKDVNLLSAVTSGLPVNTITDLIAGSQLGTNDVRFGNNPNFGVVDWHNGTAYMIRALGKKGLAKILAEPNLIVKSGDTGTFLAGGSFPIPVVTTSTIGGQSGITVQYRDFGVKMNFSPFVKENGTIVLNMGKELNLSQISTLIGSPIGGGNNIVVTSPNAELPGIEVSSLDFANAVTLSGFNIPALKVDSVRTSVDLKEGESFVIAGLIRDDWSKDLSKIPLLGDIPILGAFFREQQMSKTERELVFLVTPKLMKPMAPGQRAELPGANEPTAKQEDDLRWFPMWPTYRSIDAEQLK